MSSSASTGVRQHRIGRRDEVLEELARTDSARGIAVALTEALPDTPATQTQALAWFNEHLARRGSLRAPHQDALHYVGYLVRHAPLCPVPPQPPPPPVGLLVHDVHVTLVARVARQISGNVSAAYIVNALADYLLPQHDRVAALEALESALAQSASLQEPQRDALRFVRFELTHALEGLTLPQPPAEPSQALAQPPPAYPARQAAGALPAPYVMRLRPVHAGFETLARRNAHGGCALDPDYHKVHGRLCRAMHPAKQRMSAQLTARESCIKSLRALAELRRSMLRLAVVYCRFTNDWLQRASKEIAIDAHDDARKHVERFLASRDEIERWVEHVDTIDTELTAAVTRFNARNYNCEPMSAVAMRCSKIVAAHIPQAQT